MSERTFTRLSSKLIRLTLCAVVVSACSQTSYATECQIASIDRSAITRSAADGFSETDVTRIDRIISDLAPCVGHPDPDIRDALTYETLTRILRSRRLDSTRIAGLRQSLYLALERKDDEGFAPPFAALLLSEVARTDRVAPNMTDAEFDAMVTRASDYVRAVRDYRGFINQEGWRHGVAHGADWLMQLSLNPRLNDEQRDRIIKAVGSQIQAHDAHSYMFGEPGRLARPVLFLAARKPESAEFWADHIRAFSDPSPLESWSDAFFDEGNLARLHNVRAFLHALYVDSRSSDDEGVQALQPGLEQALQSLP